MSRHSHILIWSIAFPKTVQFMFLIKRKYKESIIALVIAFDFFLLLYVFCNWPGLSFSFTKDHFVSYKPNDKLVYFKRTFVNEKPPQGVANAARSRILFSVRWEKWAQSFNPANKRLDVDIWIIHIDLQQSLDLRSVNPGKSFVK